MKVFVSLPLQKEVGIKRRVLPHSLNPIQVTPKSKRLPMAREAAAPYISKALLKIYNFFGRRPISYKNMTVNQGWFR
jgi:hypothetical protein